MSLDPLLAEPAAIQLHAFAAMAAIALGGWQMAGAKGTARHRVLGWSWVALMAVVVATSFFIHSIEQWGRWSWIHLLSILTAVTLPPALLAARRRRRRAHAQAMTLLFVAALLITGVFTLPPGRVMRAVVFGG